MRIDKALAKRKCGETVSSKSLPMLEQTPETLLFWLLLDPDSSDDTKHANLDKVLNASDWEVDRE